MDLIKNTAINLAMFLLNGNTIRPSIQVPHKPVTSGALIEELRKLRNSLPKSEASKTAQEVRRPMAGFKTSSEGGQ